jgi:hypothetical protein
VDFFFYPAWLYCAETKGFRQSTYPAFYGCLRLPCINAAAACNINYIIPKGFGLPARHFSLRRALMSDTENPWQSPQNDSVPEKAAAQGVLTDSMLRYLKEAAPWLRFIGILGYIGCGLMVAGGIIGAIVMLAVSGLADEFGGAPAGLIALLYAVMGALLFFPSRFTYSFGDKIRNYMLSNAEQDLELALKNNKSLWKFYGILCIIYLAFIPLAIIGVVMAVVGSVFL